MVASPFGGWTVEDDLSPASWFVDALMPWDTGAFRVGSVVPDRYPAHARLVHPAHRWDGAAPGSVHIRDLDRPWELVWEGDERFTRQTGWPFGAGWTIGTPDIGTLDPVDLPPLIEVLGASTDSPDNVWALIWPGWGHTWCQDLHDAAAKISVRGNPFVLLRGTLADLTTMQALADGHAPSYWWPEDQAWVVGTDLNDFCTYVGGSDACMTALVGDARLECYVTAADALVYPMPYLPA